MLLGVDSAAPVTALWDGVVQLLGREPDAWGRPVDGPFAVTPAEVDFLRARGKRLWLWGGGTSPEVVAGDILQGLHYGNRIASLADRLGYRAGCVLGPDLEASPGWTPTGSFVAGALLQPSGWGYRPLVYFAPKHGPSAAAVSAAGEIMRYLGHPAPGAWIASWLEPAALDPRRPPDALAVPAAAGAEVLGWQWAGNVQLPGGGAVDLDLWQDSASLWTL